MRKSIYFDRLMGLQDFEYRDFQRKLIPTVDPGTVIGVRTPSLRKLAKEIYRGKEYGEFLMDLPHCFYDENQLHTMIINEMDDFEETVCQVERFLPFVDNWATCDQLRPKAFKAAPEKLIEKNYIKKWLDSSHVYAKRYGMGCLMQYFLKDNFSPEYPHMIASVKSEEYYVNMMIAWYFATALAFRWNEALPYLTNGELSDWVAKKTIQKALESYRIDVEKKEILRSIRKRISI